MPAKTYFNQDKIGKNQGRKEKQSSVGKIEFQQKHKDKKANAQSETVICHTRAMGKASRTLNSCDCH